MPLYFVVLTVFVFFLLSVLLPESCLIACISPIVMYFYHHSTSLQSLFKTLMNCFGDFTFCRMAYALLALGKGSCIRIWFLAPSNASFNPIRNCIVLVEKSILANFLETPHLHPPYSQWGKGFNLFKSFP